MNLQLTMCDTLFVEVSQCTADLTCKGKNLHKMDELKETVVICDPLNSVLLILHWIYNA